MKSSVNVNAKSKASAKPEAKAKAVIEVSAQIKAEISSTAKQEGVAFSEATKRDNSLLNLGKVVRKSLAILHERSDVQTALKPLFVKAYAENGRPEFYAVQQLARVLSTAYAEDIAAVDAAIVLKDKKTEITDSTGKVRKLNVNDVYKITTGGARLKTKNGKTVLLATKKSNRGGQNAKTPKESYAFTIGNAATAAKTAKLKLEALAIADVEAKVENGWDLEDVREAYENACQE